MKKWGGHKARRWTAAVLATKGRACTLRLPGCLVVATTGDHIIPRSQRPDLQYDVRNGRPACLPCNQKRGTRDLELVAPALDSSAFFESRGPSLTDSAGSPPQGPEVSGGTR